MLERLADYADSYIQQTLQTGGNESPLDMLYPVTLMGVGGRSFAEVFPTVCSNTGEVDPSELFESFIYQLGKEDWCFAGTSGELAYRLLYSVTASILEPNEVLPEEPYLRPRALAVFRGVPMYAYKTRRVRGDNNPEHTEISYPSSGRFNESWPEGISAVPSKSATLIHSVWIAPDGSSVGYGTPPSSTSKVLIQVPTSKYPHAAKILSSLVFLQGEAGHGVAFSLCPFEDLKFGAFSPQASRLLLPNTLELRSFLPILAGASPSEVFKALQSLEYYNIPTAPDFIGLTLPAFIIAEISGESGTMIWWGYTNTLGPNVRCAVQLTPLVAWLAFGPPHHYLAPFEPHTAVPLESVLRYWNGPKELEPEVLLPKTEPSELAAWLLGKFSNLLTK